MKKTLYVRVSAYVIYLSSFACLIQAQSQVLEVNPVVVSGSRIEQPLSQVLPSVSVITRQDIDKAQAPSLADLLQGAANLKLLPLAFIQSPKAVGTAARVAGKAARYGEKVIPPILKAQVTPQVIGGLSAMAGEE
jgi:hypothetical protein